MAYAELEPFGPLRDDLRAGTVAAAVHNCAFGRVKGARTVRAEDVFASLRATTKPQGWQAMAAALKGVTRAMGGRVVKRGEAVHDPVASAGKSKGRKPAKK